MKVLIIVLNYNGKNLLKKHLPSVIGHRGEKADVLIVDNASTDDSIDFLSKNFPEVKVLRNEENLGFGRANNRAFEEYPDYDAYVLLNNDMHVTGEWLYELVKVMEADGSIGLVGPRILYAKKDHGNRIINAAGGVIDRYDRGFDRYEGCPDGKQYKSVEDVQFLSGGAVLMRAEAVREVGGFDERMFFYYEDVDISLRIREAGWRCVYSGHATVIHDHMATAKGLWSSTKVTYMSNMNRIRSIQRRKGIVRAMIEMVRAPAEWLVYSCMSLLTGNTYRERLTEGMYECRNSK